ncbi:YopX family protein [Campylobacter sp. RM16192]|uniref:YopX family protein n=1 Tax=Campylobacter sp. RM16192 TaxID=1660080 RepID=UPI00145150BB|nr:YopX family protein [Campylobacter sp. RM16192]QCD52478.1 YopX family protein [Campylobacter sp. RM16192]
MRELKFRVWNTIDRKMLKWGDIFHLPAWEIFPGTPEQRAFDIMQYTGLRDKNGKEIYEGDIIKKIGDIKTYSIVFDGVLAAYLMDDGTGGYGLNQMLLRDFEVIGNIYENPELLKDKKMKYRKRPVEVEAFRLGCEPMPGWFLNEVKKNNIKTSTFGYTPNESGDSFYRDELQARIKTSEGTMYAEDGDYIIKGIKGEIYPCKPDIFEATYEKVEDSQC